MFRFLCLILLTLGLNLYCGPDLLAGGHSTGETEADGDTQEVQIVRRVSPDYPRKARDDAVEGWVIVGATVDPTGSAYDFRVIESSPTGYFESAALTAFQEWQFSPAMRNGEPVLGKARVRINFNLD